MKPTDARDDRARPVSRSRTKQNRRARTYWHQGFGAVYLRGGKADVVVPFLTEATCREVAERAEVNVNAYRKAAARGKGYVPLTLKVESYQDFWIYREET